MLTLVATNPTHRDTKWSSGCGSDLAFEVRDADSQVAESPAFGLCTEEYRMDGRHRAAKALLEGRPTVDAVQFHEDPTPDYVGRHPDELLY